MERVLARRRIVQISDLHILPEGELRPGVDSFENLERVLEAIEAMEHRPDLLLLTGDLADAGQPSSYRRIRAAVEPVAGRLGVPVCYLPGNHDSREQMRTELFDEAPSGTPINQVRWCGGLRLLALDSIWPGHEAGKLQFEQLDWLAAELAAAAPEGTILALHHPPIPSPIEQMASIALRDPQELASVLSGTDVLIVLVGHNHHVSAGSLGGLPVWVGSSSAYRADARFETSFNGTIGSGFSRIDIFDKTAVATHLPVRAP